jgi:hypothetical protein
MSLNCSLNGKGLETTAQLATISNQFCGTDGFLAALVCMYFPTGGDPGLNNQKIPTTLLLTPNQEFHSFGFAARDYFHDLDIQEAKKWLYFDKFKMKLHHNQVQFG